MTVVRVRVSVSLSVWVFFCFQFKPLLVATGKETGRFAKSTCMPSVRFVLLFLVGCWSVFFIAAVVVSLLL